MHFLAMLENHAMPRMPTESAGQWHNAISDVQSGPVGGAQAGLTVLEKREWQLFA